MKNIKLYEDFDVDKFIEDPFGNIHDDDSPDIEIGDFVTSYRGMGQVLDLPMEGRGLATLQLIDSSKSTIKVPVDKLVKVKKEEMELAIENMPDTIREIEKISEEIENYLEIIGAYESDEVYIPDVDLAVEILEDILIEIMDLKKKDPYLIYHKEYSDIISGFAALSNAIQDSTEDLNILNRVKRIENSFRDVNR